MHSKHFYSFRVRYSYTLNSDTLTFQVFGSFVTRFYTFLHGQFWPPRNDLVESSKKRQSKCWLVPIFHFISKKTHSHFEPKYINF
jgi:hypothetical protein